MISIEKSGLLKNILLTMGVFIVLASSFVLGLFTGWKLSSPRGYEEAPPRNRPIPQRQFNPPSSPILIIPHKPSPPPQPKQSVTKPQPKPKIEVTITPTNVPQPPKAITTPPPTNEASTQETPQKLYKVTIGPFEEQEAKKIQDELTKQGKEAILVPVGNKYKLQLGAFSQKENAQQLVDELRKSGYNPLIEEK
ncbi:MAG: SPOR domain-containing protein [bacterium]